MRHAFNHISIWENEQETTSNEHRDEVLSRYIATNLQYRLSQTRPEKKEQEERKKYKATKEIPKSSDN